MTALDPLAQARDLHRRIAVFDGHLDIPLDFNTPGHEADSDGPGQFDLAKARRGGLSGVCIALNAPLARGNPTGVASGRTAQETRYAALQRMVSGSPDKVAFANSPAEFGEIAASGRMAVVLALQNAAPFAGDLEAFRSWAGRGVQMTALTFIGNNAFADSSRPYPFAGDFNHGGLSDLGRDAVRLMNDIGMVIDVSQLSDNALRQTLSTTRTPVVASHSAPRGVHPTRRNLADEDLSAIAAGGGLVNVVGFAYYLTEREGHVLTQLRDLWLRYGLTGCKTMDDAIFHPETARWEDERFWEFLHEFHVILDLANPIADVPKYVDAVEYVVRQIGIDHVGLSSDFNHGGGLVGWRDSSETHNVTAELLRRGFSEVEVGKLWGGNFMRVWANVQADAA